MLKKIGEFLFFLLLGWLAWVVVLGASPQERMDRACTSVSGPGNLLASMAGALNNDWGIPISRGTLDATYRCRLTLWNFFYARQWQAEHPGQPLPGQSDAAPQYSPLVAPMDAVRPTTPPAKPAAPSEPPQTAPKPNS
jgi:hypothetical protein